MDYCSLIRNFAPMNLKTIISSVAKVVLPFVLGGAILWWMYRGEDFSVISHVLTEEMDWTWMLLSFPFGILAQMFRGWRWKQTLDPIDLRPSSVEQTDGGREIKARNHTCINAVFISYAASLIIPRIGEFSRCAILKRYDGVSFSKALGTVVTERAVDTLIVLLYSGIILLLEMSVFGTFFRKTGTSMDRILNSFSLTGWIVTAICGVAVAILLHLLLKNFSIYNKVKMTLSGIPATVSVLLGRHLGDVFPALLSDVLLFRLHRKSWHRLCHGIVCGGQLRCYRTNTKRSRSVALCHQDHADTLWRGR